MNFIKNLFETKFCNKGCNKTKSKEDNLNLDELSTKGKEYLLLSDGHEEYDNYPIRYGEKTDIYDQLDKIYNKMRQDEEKSSSLSTTESIDLVKKCLEEPYGQYVEYGEDNIRAQLAEIDLGCLFVDEQDTDLIYPFGIVYDDKKDNYEK